MEVYHISAALIICKKFTQKERPGQENPNYMWLNALRLFFISGVYEIFSSKGQLGNAYTDDDRISVYNLALAYVLVQIARPIPFHRDLNLLADFIIVLVLYFSMGNRFLVIVMGLFVLIELIRAPFQTWRNFSDKILHYVVVYHLAEEGPYGYFCVALTMVFSARHALQVVLGALFVYHFTTMIRPFAAYELISSLLSAESLCYIITGFLYCWWEQRSKRRPHLAEHAEASSRVMIIPDATRFLAEASSRG